MVDVYRTGKLECLAQSEMKKRSNAEYLRANGKWDLCENTRE